MSVHAYMYLLTVSANVLYNTHAQGKHEKTDGTSSLLRYSQKSVQIKSQEQQSQQLWLLS